MSVDITVALEGEITIYRAAEVQQQLQLALSVSGMRLDIDLSAVSELDSAGVQLLMAAKRAAQASGGDVTLSRHSPAVVEVFDLMDLAAFFGDPIVMSARGVHEEHAA